MLDNVRRGFVGGELDVIYLLGIEAVRARVPEGRHLKTILETGELRDPALIRRASEIAIAGGASIASDVVREIDRWEAGQWEAHVVGLPPNQFPLAEGRGYFVRANRPVTWTNPGLTGTNRVVARDLPTVPEEDPPPDQ